MSDLGHNSLENTSKQSAVTFRAFLLGLFGTILICAIAPYNFSVANNTDLIGNALPSGVLMFFFAFAIFINAPLYWIAPKYAFRPGELAVAMAMILCSCTLPVAGLMRYLPGFLTGFWNQATFSGEIEGLLRELNIPSWFWPTFSTADPIQRGNDPLVSQWMTRIPTDDDSIWGHLKVIEWSRWITPALSWGIFFAAMYGAILCLMAIFREQWASNERLPFPLATVFVSLIEKPEPGRKLNRMFRSPLFWIAFSIVFCLHGINAMHKYLPGHIPEMPLQFDLRSILADPPFTYVDWQFKEQSIIFTVIGLAYFIRGSVAFSLWFSFLIYQCVRMSYGSVGSDFSYEMKNDQMFGATFTLAAGILFVARHHLAGVIRQMFKGAPNEEARGRFISYRVAGWGWVICMLVMIFWLIAAGATPISSIIIVFMVMTAYLVVAKIVAETGLPYAQTVLYPRRPWILLAPMGVRTSLDSFFHSSFMSSLLMEDVRQSLPSYSLHAMRASDTIHDGQTPRKIATKIILCIIIALIVGYIVSGVSTLYIHYTYAASLDKNGADLDQNRWGWYNMPYWGVLNPSNNYRDSKTVPIEPHSHVAHISIGVFFTGLFSVLRMKFSGWPLHPVCVLLGHTWSIQMTWFSIFLGWLSKSLIVRFGGSQLYEKSRDIFLAMIIGEAIATAFWIIINLIRAASGLNFEPSMFIPA